MQDVNLALVAELAWKFIKEPEISWVTMLREKYVRGLPIMQGESKPNDSFV